MVRIRIILTTILSIIALTSVLFIISRTILIESYLTIEHEEMQRNLERVDHAIKNHSDSLNIKLRDWAQWDDTYHFVGGNDPTYIDTNLDDSTLINLEINLMGFVDAQGNVVFSKYIDLDTASELPSFEIMQAVLQSKLYSGPNDRVSGSLLLPQGLLLIEGLPTVMSDGGGEANGTVFFGRFIDGIFVEKIEELTRLPVQIKTGEMVRTDAHYAIDNSDEKVVEGYFFLTDAEDRAIGRVSVLSERTIYQQGVRTVAAYTILSSVSILFFGVIILILFEFLLLRRLSHMGKEVDSISEDDLKNARVTDNKNDDIGKLGGTINNLLEKLAISQAKVRESARLEMIANEKLKKSLISSEDMNKLMVGRELKMIELKQKMEELENKLKREQ